jgi:type I restriction enzyme M protein
LANNTANNGLESRLWGAADELRANSKLKSSEYSVPVLGLIFLRYADFKFEQAEQEIKAKAVGSRRQVGKIDYQAQGVLYMPEDARFASLLTLPEGANIGQAINDAMRAIERENEALREVLPKTYNRLGNPILVSLLKTLHAIAMDVQGDVFGKIYEYFLGKFAMSEGQKGGEFFTPFPIVSVIVEIIEPYHGIVDDPACGAGGMFVQSARFVRRHKGNTSQISIYGQERVAETVRLCQMNLAVHGLEGTIRQANTYYEDLHNLLGRVDFLMANPPFNVNRVDKERIKDDPRFPLGMPRVDNANYLWIQIFYSALSPTGRAGFVMANSASDARGSELEIRKQLIQAGAVDVMMSVGPNFFYTVTLPCTLWFLDRGKAAPHPRPLSPRGRGEESSGVVQGRGVQSPDTVLFIDARHIYRQLDRAHRDFTPAQIEFLANIVRLYRGQPVEMEHITNAGAEDRLPNWDDAFPGGVYRDIPGLCRVATRAEIEAQGWSLNPGRYVGVAERAADDFDFFERLEELNEELEVLNSEAHELEERISDNVLSLMEAAS